MEGIEGGVLDATIVPEQLEPQLRLVGFLKGAAELGDKLVI